MLLVNTLAQELACLEDRKGSRDNLQLGTLLHLAQSLGIDDATDEEIHDTLTSGQDVDLPKLRHHILRNDALLVALSEDLL